MSGSMSWHGTRQQAMRRLSHSRFKQSVVRHGRNPPDLLELTYWFCQRVAAKLSVLVSRRSSSLLLRAFDQSNCSGNHEED